jgi:predicted Fe-S protein YdhL (DUF1289 family)
MLKLLALAEQVQNMSENLPSPCMSVCKMDPDKDWCMGCLRTLDELRVWSRLGDEGKRVIWAHVMQRARAQLASI